ncbi:UPF0503 protein, chloroplastic [Glycine soja]|uniref:UPF0503 protein, chloroplastic n=2 Tax=Glycine soja TaxID=3848 RepID=A0A445FVF9_GLYSO|nr:UPF0503 protein, chloroplastic [Glycine soja]
MQPQCPSTSCARHLEEKFLGFCPSCLRERLIILGHESLSCFHKSLLSLPSLSVHPHRPFASCDRHPEEQFTGFCPSCLYERLTILKHDSSSSIYKHPITSTTSPKAIFRSFTTMLDANCLPRSSSFTFQPMLRRSKSCPIFKTKGLSCALDLRRKSCDFMAYSTIFSIFNPYDKQGIPKKEPKVESHNLASLSIIRDRVQENIKEEPSIELEANEEAEKTIKAMEDHMDIDSQVKKSCGRDSKECIWFATTIFTKKFRKWRQNQKMKKNE